VQSGVTFCFRQFLIGQHVLLAVRFDDYAGLAEFYVDQVPLQQERLRGEANAGLAEGIMQTLLDECVDRGTAHARKPLLKGSSGLLGELWCLRGGMVSRTPLWCPLASLAVPWRPDLIAGIEDDVLDGLPRSVILGAKSPNGLAGRIPGRYLCPFVRIERSLSRDACHVQRCNRSFRQSLSAAQGMPPCAGLLELHRCDPRR